MAAYRAGVQLPCEGCRVLQRMAWWGAGSGVPGGTGGGNPARHTRHRASPVVGGVCEGAVEGKRDCGADAVRHLVSYRVQ